MSRKPDYDVIIAGGGPAGSTAGYILSSAGLDVLIIDKKNFPRQKLCGGCIPYKSMKLLERVFTETPDTLKENGLINYSSGRYEIRTGRRLISRGTASSPFYFVERAKYDHYLLKRARDAGSEIIEGEAVESLDIHNSKVRTSGGKTLSANFIIGADGVNSRVRQSIPSGVFDRTAWSRSAAAAFEVTIEKEKAKKSFDHPVLYYGFVEWGYAWIFPNRETIRVGMCGLKQKNRKSILSLFRDFLSQMDLQDEPFEGIQGSVLPYGNYLRSPAYRNILLAGDAAGFADPLLGEGIFYAQRSAELAAKAILAGSLNKGAENSSGPVNSAYMRSLKEHIYPELDYSGKMQNMVFTFWDKNDFLPLKIFMGIFGRMMLETVQGIRSYRWMSRVI